MAREVDGMTYLMKGEWAHQKAVAGVRSHHTLRPSTSNNRQDPNRIRTGDLLRERRTATAARIAAMPNDGGVRGPSRATSTDRRTASGSSSPSDHWPSGWPGTTCRATYQTTTGSGDAHLLIWQALGPGVRWPPREALEREAQLDELARRMPAGTHLHGMPSVPPRVGAADGRVEK
jgi:hypothetical protein